MKAIYINLDPYLAAFAAWIKGGKSGPAPSFDPLPLAVTIPLGESACIYLNGYREGDPGDTPSSEYFAIDGQIVGAFMSVGEGDNIAENIAPALSALIPTAHYYVRAVSGDVSVTVIVSDEEGNENSFTIPVLVRREQAQGPVDLVDFTPPAAAPSAEQINAALGGTGAEEDAPLAGVELDGVVYRSDAIVVGEIDGKNVLCVGES